MANNDRYIVFVGLLAAGCAQTYQAAARQKLIAKLDNSGCRVWIYDTEKDDILED